MADVKHMKWWGWGVEGVSFHHENKPAFRPFVINAIDLDVNTAPAAPMSLDDLAIPAPLIGDQLLAELSDACIRTGRVPVTCYGFGPVTFRGCQMWWSIRATRLKYS
jgi:hypothetical protein